MPVLANLPSNEVHFFGLNKLLVREGSASLKRKNRESLKRHKQVDKEQLKPSSKAQVLFGGTTLRRIKTSNEAYAAKKKVLYSTKKDWRSHDPPTMRE